MSLGIEALELKTARDSLSILHKKNSLWLHPPHGGGY